MAKEGKHTRGQSPYGKAGSILQTADAATLRKIKRARARYLRDQRAMETWAKLGFQSDSFGDEEDEGAWVDVREDSIDRSLWEEEL